MAVKIPCLNPKVPAAPVKMPKPLPPAASSSSAQKLSRISESTAMDWTFPDGQEPPEGSDRKFLSGSLKSKSFLDVTMEHPEQYFSTRKSKTLSAEATEYLRWVEKHFTAIPWKKGMTVMDAMRYAKRGKQGIDFKFSGNGDTAFLTQIDDLKNEGGGEGKKNWILRVNKKLATESFGVFELNSGDVIRWQFEVFKL